MANQTQNEMQRRENTEVERPEHLSGVRVVTPPVDIFENDHELLLRADLPGVGKDTMRVHIEKDTLVIEGKRPVQGVGDVVYRRTFTVAQIFDTDKVNARLERGVLEVHLPKSDRIRPRQIPVQIG